MASQSLVKSSVQRGIRSKILEQFPSIEPIAEDLIPKKASIIVLKCLDHVQLVAINKEILFFNHRDGPYLPTLKLLHQFPDILPRVQVDRGAIKFVLSGAQIMCPGLTSAGGRLEVDLPAGAAVAIMAEGKQHALAVGILKLSTQDIKTVNKGIGIETMHYLNDGLWTSSMDI